MVRLFTRTYLDDSLLLLLTEGLNTGAISADCIPVRVLRCADRCLHSAVHGYRCAAIGFHVARVMSTNQPNYFKTFAVHVLLSHFVFSKNIGRPDSTSLLVLERLLCQMTTDMDSRVRLSAIEGLSLLSGVEDGLTIHTYNTVKNSVGDSHRQVRILALRILLVFANRMPTLTFSKSSDVKLQLCDDAFSIVCDAVNDQEVMVRTEAATILGEFQIVSDFFLDQTLDKKMMKTVQDSSGREQVKKVHQSRFAITQGPQQSARESRWKSSHLGYQRQKASTSSEWSSGKELNARCPPSESAAAQDDESESIVPRGACGAFVSALEDEFMCEFGFVHWFYSQNTKEQLETVLKCLDDAIVDSRQALRDLLAKAEFADAECMRICSRALLNCLHRFPADKNQIYRCLSEVGARHAVFVHGMVRELLGLHLVYDTREQQIDDVFYIAKLILVLNAAANYEPIVSLLPECVLKHYRFLRAAAPDLVAPIKCLQRATSRCCSFIASLCEISSALESLTQVVLRGGGDIKDASNLVHQELVRIRCAEHQFAGLPPEMLSFLIEAGMFLSLLEQLVEMTLNPERYAQIVLNIRAVIEEAENRWAVNGEPCEQAIALISAILDPLERVTAETKKILSVGTFGHLLVTHAPFLPSSFPDVGKIRSKWAQISEPNRDVAIEKPICFVAGLPCAVKFVASLHNLSQSDLRNLRVQVDYPNNTRGFFRPLTTDISKEGDRVSSLVLISSSEAWSDAADVTLTLFRCLTRPAARSLPQFDYEPIR
ncbi:HEAT repeat protein [Ostertagia ostertagi]